MSPEIQAQTKGPRNRITCTSSVSSRIGQSSKTRTFLTTLATLEQRATIVVLTSMHRVLVGGKCSEVMCSFPDTVIIGSGGSSDRFQVQSGRGF